MELSGEPWRPLTTWIIKDNPYVKKLTMPQLWEWTQKRENYRIEYAEHWNATATGKSENGVPTDAVDVILCPVGPGAAPSFNCAKYWGYTSQWNLLDYPSLVFPITKVDPEVDLKDEEYQPMTEDDRFNYELCKNLPMLFVIYFSILVLINHR